MSVIELPVQIRLADLLRAIERLSPAEFTAVASKVEELRQAHRSQPEMLEQVYRQLPPARQRRLESLIEKLETESLDETERAELVAISAEAEQLDAERAAAVLALAEQRNIPFAQLWDELNPLQR
ncbi:MAG: hypothetical protein R6W76_10745 [Caldilinea sp.]